MAVVELQLGVAETLVEYLVGVGGVFLDGNGRDVGVGEDFEGSGVGIVVGSAGEDDAADGVLL